MSDNTAYAPTQAPLFRGMGRWFVVPSRDRRAVGLYSRHYSSGKNGKGVGDWLEYGIAALGSSMILLTLDGRALFVWTIEQYRQDGQRGVNCAVFRNEGPHLSSELILEAERLAWNRWPGERLFTFVDGDAVRSSNPGYCFQMAGWRKCGVSGRGLLIFEKLPTQEALL